MYQTVIFDLDGTLLDTIGDLADAANYVCRLNGWPEYTEEAVRGMVGHGILDLVKKFSPEGAQSSLMLMSTLHQFNRRYGAHNMDRTRPYEGIPALLARLKAAGVRMAVCSNKADEFSRAIVAHYFPDTFDVVRGNLPGTPVKPDPGVARDILARMGVSAAGTLMVGDSDVDIRTGQNAGLRTCGVTWGFRSRESLVEAGADMLVETAEALEHLILH